MAADVGTVGSWATAAVAAVVAWLVYRGGGGGAMAILRTSNEVLESRNRDLVAQAARDKVAMESLRSSRDFAQALGPVLAQISAHEQSHLDALTSITSALDAIARKLGVDDPNGDAQSVQRPATVPDR